jgi:hypothetical protein
MGERTRVEIIEEVLIYHRNHNGPEGLTCGCGYVQPIGKSIMLHRAELIDEALAYAASSKEAPF